MVLKRDLVLLRPALGLAAGLGVTFLVSYLSQKTVWRELNFFLIRLEAAFDGVFLWIFCICYSLNVFLNCADRRTMVCLVKKTLRLYYLWAILDDLTTEATIGMLINLIVLLINRAKWFADQSKLSIDRVSTDLKDLLSIIRFAHKVKRQIRSKKPNYFNSSIKADLVSCWWLKN